MPFYTRFNKIEVPFEIQQFTREIEMGQPDAFFRRLRSFFADTPYEVEPTWNVTTRMYYSLSSNW